MDLLVKLLLKAIVGWINAHPNSPFSYEFGAGGIQGKFAGHGVRGEFCFEIDRVTVTLADKPFWLPTILLKQKITEGLEAFCSGLAQRPSS